VQEFVTENMLGQMMSILIYAGWEAQQVEERTQMEVLVHIISWTYDYYQNMWHRELDMIMIESWDKAKELIRHHSTKLITKHGHAIIHLSALLNSYCYLCDTKANKYLCGDYQHVEIQLLKERLAQMSTTMQLLNINNSKSTSSNNENKSKGCMRCSTTHHTGGLAKCPILSSATLLPNAWCQRRSNIWSQSLSPSSRPVPTFWSSIMCPNQPQTKINQYLRSIKGNGQCQMPTPHVRPGNWTVWPSTPLLPDQPVHLQPLDINVFSLTKNVNVLPTCLVFVCR
jgi:hypothetical protein